jgi:hypothetical protein
MENPLDEPDRWADFIRKRTDLFEIAELPKDAYRSREAWTTFLAAEWRTISVAPKGAERDSRLWALVELVTDYFKESQTEFYEPALFSFLDKKWKLMLRASNLGRRRALLVYQRGFIAVTGFVAILGAISVWVFPDAFEGSSTVRASVSAISAIGGLYCLYVAFLAPRSTVTREFRGL